MVLCQLAYVLAEEAWIEENPGENMVIKKVKNKFVWGLITWLTIGGIRTVQGLPVASFFRLTFLMVAALRLGSDVGLPAIMSAMERASRPMREVGIAGIDSIGLPL